MSLPECLLEVRGLAVHYGGIRAVKGLDLEVSEGEVVCLIGANGAGKTTTLRALAGLIPAAAGSIRYAGAEIIGPSGAPPGAARDQPGTGGARGLPPPVGG